MRSTSPILPRLGIPSIPIATVMDDAGTLSITFPLGNLLRKAHLRTARFLSIWLALRVRRPYADLGHTVPIRSAPWVAWRQVVSRCHENGQFVCSDKALQQKPPTARKSMQFHQSIVETCKIKARNLLHICLSLCMLPI